MHIVKLARDQPAVVAPLGQPLPRGGAHPGQVRGQARNVVDLHSAGSLPP